MLLTFNAELLVLMLEKIKKQELTAKVCDFFKIDTREAETFLDGLYLEYKNIGLLDRLME